MDLYYLEHMQDLSERSRKQDCFTFSDFLTMDEQNLLLQNKKSLGSFTFYGGTEGTERNMTRFGDEALLGYSVPFPILCLRISPKNQKFADSLSHRDILGTIMGTGIERSQIGDIILKENVAYVFVNEAICPYLCENIKIVRHTTVVCERCDSVPKGALFTTAPLRGIAASLRLDCIVGEVWRLSRKEAGNLISAKKVYINGALCETISRQLKLGEIVSARGYGKFIFKEVTGNTKKGKLNFLVEIYK